MSSIAAILSLKKSINYKKNLRRFKLCLNVMLVL